MKHLIITAASLSILTTNSFAMSETDCNTMWKQADTNNNGTLDAPESARYAAMMRIASKTAAPGDEISQSVFLENCAADVFAVNETMDGAPLKGANSFTEDQAKDRVAASGIPAPASMTKDSDGIWRGTVTQDGKSLNVAVDFKGNVVTQ